MFFEFFRFYHSRANYRAKTHDIHMSEKGELEKKMQEKTFSFLV